MCMFLPGGCEKARDLRVDIMSEAYKLSLRKIRKTFPGVIALSDFSLDVRKGTIHALVGENGAGKSTMMKIINGVYRADSGEIFIDGQRVELTDPSVSAKYGIAMIFQELNFMPEFTVAEHLFLTREPQKIKGIMDWKALFAQAQELLTSEGLPYNPRTKMKNLSVSDIQLIEIARAISKGADILIMDEPTASISEFEVKRLFKKIKQLREAGVTILYISHKMDEIFELADDVTIIRDGFHIETRPTNQFNANTIVAAMVGRKIEDVYPPKHAEVGETVLEVSGLSAPEVCENVSFYARKGEIVGFAGLVGSGRTEILSLLSGLRRYREGTIRMYGRPVSIRSVSAAMKNGILMATEDRKRFGLIGIRSILENIMLPNLEQVSKGGVINWKKERATAGAISADLRVKAPNLKTQVVTLSGGNQQKVVLAKWLLHNPQVLILDEPTKGIDVGAKHEIYKIMRDLSAKGVPIIMISSELPEIIGLCDRVYVVCEHRIVAEYSGKDITQENIMKVQTGGTE